MILADNTLRHSALDPDRASGITRFNASSVIAAGADSVAVISDLLPDPLLAVEDFQRLLS